MLFMRFLQSMSAISMEASNDCFIHFLLSYISHDLNKKRITCYNKDWRNQYGTTSKSYASKKL